MSNVEISLSREAYTSLASVCTADIKQADIAAVHV
jgi:hypothetical protein